MAQPENMSVCQATCIKGTETSYLRKERLGKGNFGIVFRGSHQGEEVAVKRLELDRLDQEDREVKLQIKLEHENVLKILAVDEDDDYR
jgi:predicted Ser/Thr protein kinase